MRGALWLLVGGVATYVVYAQGWAPAAISGFLPEQWVAPILAAAGGTVLGVLSVIWEPRALRVSRPREGYRPNGPNAVR